MCLLAGEGRLFGAVWSVARFFACILVQIYRKIASKIQETFSKANPEIQQIWTILSIPQLIRLSPSQKDYSIGAVNP